jgi:hypothetical protein
MKKVVIVCFVLASFFTCAFAAEKSGFAELKSKISAGCSVTGSSASVRIWPTDNLGLELSAGLALTKDGTNLPVQVQMIFPLAENGNFALNLAPGMGITYTNTKANTNIISNGYSLSVGADLIFELALPMISENLSIGSGIGAWFGYTSTSIVNGTTTPVFNADIVRVTPVVIRYYF